MAWYDEILEAADPYLPGRSGPGVRNLSEIKGQPISTLSDAELLEKYGPMPNLEAGATSLSTGREVLTPYYGENLDAEIAKAKAFDKTSPEAALPLMKRQPAGLRQGRAWGEDQDKGPLAVPKGRYYGDAYTIDYKKIDEPIPTQVQSEPDRQFGATYSPEKGIKLNSPEFIGARSKNWSQEPVGDYVQQYLDMNNSELSDIKAAATNPRSDVRETWEHEAGHHFTNSSSDASHGVGHIGKPREMSNALGKIQRDTYVLYGQRFETPSQFQDYLRQERDKPQNDRFKGYSIEAKRGLRSLMDSGKEVRLQAVNAIPKFVTADPKPEPRFQDYLDYWTAQQRPVAS